MKAMELFETEYKALHSVMMPIFRKIGENPSMFYVEGIKTMTAESKIMKRALSNLKRNLLFLELPQQEQEDFEAIIKSRISKNQIAGNNLLNIAALGRKIEIIVNLDDKTLTLKSDGYEFSTMCLMADEKPKGVKGNTITFAGSVNGLQGALLSSKSNPLAFVLYGTELMLVETKINWNKACLEDSSKLYGKLVF